VTHDGIFVAARVIDKLVAAQILLVLDGQAKFIGRVARRSLFKIHSSGVHLVTSRANAPHTRVTLGADSRPVGGARSVSYRDSQEIIQLLPLADVIDVEEMAL